MLLPEGLPKRHWYLYEHRLSKWRIELVMRKGKLGIRVRGELKVPKAIEAEFDIGKEFTDVWFRYVLFMLQLEGLSEPLV